MKFSFLFFFISFLLFNFLSFSFIINLNSINIQTNTLNFTLIPSSILLNNQINNNNINGFSVSTNGGSIFMGCSWSESAYIYSRQDINFPWILKQEFTNINYDIEFGSDVSINVNYYDSNLRLAIVSAPGYKNQTGIVFLYRELSKNNWMLINNITGKTQGDRFGDSVFLDKNCQVAIGAPEYGIRGIVYIYRIETDYTFSLVGTIQSPYTPSNGNVRTGCALIGSDDIVNTVLIVGVCPTFSSLGVAGVYLDLTLISRTSSEDLTSTDTTYGASEMSLALATRYDGSYPAPSWLALGQAKDVGIGSVTVYQVVSTDGAIVLNTVLLKPPNGKIGDRFGCALAIYDNTSHIMLYVGSAGYSNTGAVYIYIRPIPKSKSSGIDPYTWVLATIVKPSISTTTGIIELFGSRVSYDQSLLVVTGAHKEDNTTTVFGVAMDVSSLDLRIPPTRSPTESPTLKPSQNSASSSNDPPVGFISLTIYIPVTLTFIIIVLIIVIYFYRRQVISSKSSSFNTIYIQRKTTKQIHCEPDPLNNLEAGIATLQKDRWIIQPSQLTIPVAPNLGSGGYGVVKRGILKDGKRKYDVAVKILLDRHVHSEEARKVLLREAALMVELRSPFIVQVFGVCDSKMLVMELMNYGSLYALVETVEPASFPLALRVQLMIDSIRGIEYLHESDVVHADMKSLNILLCSEGGSLKAKITDFGLSRIAMGDNCESTNTNHISIRWAAPEMLQDRPKISKSIDMYAFGIIMWEIIALKRPYADMNLAPLIQKVVSGGREDIPDDTPSCISSLIRKCWAQYSEDRPKASYVREMLINFQQSCDTLGESIMEPT